MTADISSEVLNASETFHLIGPENSRDEAVTVVRRALDAVGGKVHQEGTAGGPRFTPR